MQNQHCRNMSLWRWKLLIMMMFGWLAGQQDFRYICHRHFQRRMIKHTWSSILTPCKLVLTTASIDKGRLGEKSFLIHLSTAISKYIVHINTVEKKIIREMFVPNHHHVKLAIVRLSVALLWEQTRTKIWSSRLASPCCCIVKLVLIVCCLLTQSYLFIVTRKGKVALLSVTLWNPTAKAVRGIEAWKDGIECFSPYYDHFQVSSACEGEEKVVYAGKHGTREEEKGCSSLPWSKLADFS